MPYREPIFFKGGYYHVYSRGSEKRSIFLDRADRERFLKRLKEYKEKYDVSVVCYCLMPNHYHLLVKQNSDDSLSNFVLRLNLAYAMYFNKRYERVGPLFQSRFKAKSIDKDEYLIHLSRYIHLNPLSAGGFVSLSSFPWSSLKHYLGKKTDDVVDSEFILAFFGGSFQKYEEFVKGEAGSKLRNILQDILFEEISPVQARGLRKAGDE